MPTWTRFFVYRAEGVRTTWALRLGVMALLVIVPWSTSACWTAALGRSLVCEAGLTPSDAILVENFDPDYLLFERARQLRREGLAPRVLVPVPTDRGTEEPNDVALGFVVVMARISGVGPFDVIPFRQVEPITLNAARDIQRYLEREHIHSVIVVTPLFRSRRSQLVYGATLGRAGIAVRCEPVDGSRGVTNWTKTWHGIQNVVEQWLKLQYYRLRVMPSLNPPDR